jgi:hypothetical protein
MWTEAVLTYFWYYPGIRQKEQRKTTKTIFYDKRCSGRDSIRPLPEYTEKFHRLS